MKLSDQWETPTSLFNELNNEFHFDVDLCASDKNHKCKHYYTESNTCLTKDWTIYKTCFMNPPYSNSWPFIQKALVEQQKGITIVCLLKSDTSTKLFHVLYNKPNIEIRFIKGRLKFELAGKPCLQPANFPSMIVIIKGLKRS